MLENAVKVAPCFLFEKRKQDKEKPFGKKKVSITRHVKALCLTQLRTKISEQQPLNRKDKKYEKQVQTT